MTASTSFILRLVTVITDRARRDIRDGHTQRAETLLGELRDSVQEVLDEREAVLGLNRKFDLLN